MYKNLVIVGGGFAGTRTAKLLEHTLPPDWTLTLVSQENFITFNPLLPEVVGASIMPSHVIAPHRQMIHCSHVCMAQVSEIDTVAREIHYLGEGPGVLRYDQLVLTCGSSANLDIIPGMSRNALPLKTLGDALFLRNRIIARLEQAELQPDIEHRRWLTSFVVVGGGFSGVETAGELADFLYATLKYYKRIRREDLRIVLLHSGDRLLPELSATLGEFTLRKMRDRDVDVRLGTRAVSVTDRHVQLDSGEFVVGGTVICTIGTQPNSLLESIPGAKSRGRLTVNPDMSVPGVAGVWAAGDCAAVPNALDGKVCPPTAQFAEAQAKQLASNILAHLAGAPTKPFRFRPKGQLSSIGHNKAVAEVFGLRISGFVAWLMWRGLSLLRIPTLARKTRLFLEWNWAMFFPPDLAHLGYRRTQRHIPQAVSVAEPPESRMPTN
ncbi:MAG: NAD(P)/FAD-dependent oxidoreductase, partial [Gammaproteobacteria bacterium]|nr:NAD(P)/FAD-dependent oxidoreductase [Gammaproteobacteria bacterium]